MPDLALPEFIRGTRSVGEPSAPGSDHERVMRPLRVARRAALESLGIEVLGEVLTFTPTGETAVGTAAPGDDPR